MIVIAIISIAKAPEGAPRAPGKMLSKGVFILPTPVVVTSNTYTVAVMVVIAVILVGRLVVRVTVSVVVVKAMATAKGARGAKKAPGQGQGGSAQYASVNGSSKGN